MEHSNRDKRLVVAVVAADSGVGRSVLRGIAAAAERFGLALETIDPGHTGGDLTPFASLLGAADGVIVRLGEYWRQIHGFLREDAPAIGIDIRPHADSGLWAVLNPDDAKIGAVAAEELLAARLESYALVPALPATPWGTVRDKGFLDRIRSGGRDVRVYEPRAPWRGATERDSLSCWLASLPKPFGLFARNDVIAKFAIGACKSAGIGVPEDAAVIGADDDESVCLYSSPPLSSVRIDHEGGGRRAAEALVDCLGRERPDRPASLRFGPCGVARRASTGTAVSRTDGDRLLAAGLGFIASHFGSPLVGAEDVAAAMGVGRRRAERLFRASGATIRGKMEEIRLAHVKTLLTQTDFPLRRIAAECGFSTDIYLSELFRKRFGISPGAWRREHGG